jgi:putative toxin-antitoxin system, toxin component
MKDLRFEWDEKKNEINIKKHGVSFEEASTTFYDDLAIIIPDEKHSEEEERFTLIGKSEKNRILYVSHCEKVGGIIRLISARKAMTREVKEYLRR